MFEIPGLHSGMSVAGVPVELYMHFVLCKHVGVSKDMYIEMFCTFALLLDCVNYCERGS